MAHLVLGRTGARLLEGRGRDNLEGGALRGKAGRFWVEGVGEQGDTREGRASPVVFHPHVLDPLLEKWPLGNSAEANRASPRPGLLARGPGKKQGDFRRPAGSGCLCNAPSGQRYFGLGRCC